MMSTNLTNYSFKVVTGNKSSLFHFEPAINQKVFGWFCLISKFIGTAFILIKKKFLLRECNRFVALRLRRLQCEF